MRLLFLGGDARMIYAAKALSPKYEVSVYGSENAPFALADGIYSAVILPLPLSRDGKTIFAPMSAKPVLFGELKNFTDADSLVIAGGKNAALSDVCGQIGCGLYDYFSDETLTLQNAALTAEAAAALLIMSSEGALLGSSVLIAGSGRIARFLTKRLRAFGCDVTIAARSAEKRAAAQIEGYKTCSLEEAIEMLSQFDYIVNTIPAPLFGEREFSSMKKTAVWQELASLPEMPAKEFAERTGIKYIYAAGLPGKYSPKSAGEFIAKAVERIISEHLPV